MNSSHVSGGFFFHASMSYRPCSLVAGDPELAEGVSLQNLSLSMLRIATLATVLCKTPER